MSDREVKIILQILERGDSIRRIDGRYKDSYVDQAALETLVSDGRAEVYKLQGYDFVRRPTPLAPDTATPSEAG
jgi:hypothetical protein